METLIQVLDNFKKLLNDENIKAEISTMNIDGCIYDSFRFSYKEMSCGFTHDIFTTLNSDYDKFVSMIKREFRGKL